MKTYLIRRQLLMSLQRWLHLRVCKHDIKGFNGSLTPLGPIWKGVWLLHDHNPSFFCSFLGGTFKCLFLQHLGPMVEHKYQEDWRENVPVVVWSFCGLFLLKQSVIDLIRMSTQWLTTDELERGLVPKIVYLCQWLKCRTLMFFCSCHVSETFLLKVEYILNLQRNRLTDMIITIMVWPGFRQLGYHLERFPVCQGFCPTKWGDKDPA